MIDSILQFVAVAACAVIIWRVEPAINRMSRRTPLLVRGAFWSIMVAASGAVILIVLGGQVPDWPAALGAVGTALLLFCERRLRYLSKTPKEAV